MSFDNFVIGIIVFLSTLLNVILLLTLFKQRPVYEIKNLLLINLASSSLLLGVTAYPIELYNLLSENSKKTNLCVLSSILIFGLSLVAIWTLTLLSVERLISVKYPLFKELLLNFSYTCVITSIVLFTWLASAFWSIIPLFGWSSYALESRKAHRCNINFQDRDVNTMSYSYSLMLFCYVIPVYIITYCFYQVKKELKQVLQTVKRSKDLVSSLSIETQHAERNQTIVVFVMMLAFLIAWTPYAIMVIILTAYGEVPYKLYSLSALLAKSSSFYNPIIYGLLNKRLHRSSTNVLRKRVSPTELFRQQDITITETVASSQRNTPQS